MNEKNLIKEYAVSQHIKLEEAEKIIERKLPDYKPTTIVRKDSFIEHVGMIKSKSKMAKLLVNYEREKNANKAESISPE